MKTENSFVIQIKRKNYSILKSSFKIYLAKNDQKIFLQDCTCCFGKQLDVKVDHVILVSALIIGVIIMKKYIYLYPFKIKEI